MIYCTKLLRSDLRKWSNFRSYCFFDSHNELVLLFWMVLATLWLQASLSRSNHILDCVGHCIETRMFKKPWGSVKISSGTNTYGATFQSIFSELFRHSSKVQVAFLYRGGYVVTRNRFRKPCGKWSNFYCHGNLSSDISLSSDMINGHVRLKEIRLKR